MGEVYTLESVACVRPFQMSGQHETNIVFLSKRNTLHHVPHEHSLYSPATQMSYISQCCVPPALPAMLHTLCGGRIAVLNITGVHYLELPLLLDCCCCATLVKWSDMFMTTRGCRDTLTLLGTLVSTELPPSLEPASSTSILLYKVKGQV